MPEKLPWFRLYQRIIDDEKIRLLAFEDRWHFIALCCLKADGLLDQPEGDLKQRKIAVKMGVQARELDEVKRRLFEVGLCDENMQPMAWEELQFKSDTDRTASARKRRQRERNRVSRVTVTDVTRTDTDTDTDKKHLVHSHPDRFEEFWRTYPKREGPNPKKPARIRFGQLTSKGISPDVIIAEARRLADAHPEPTRFIPQAITVLNQERWDSDIVLACGDEFCPDDWPATRPLVSRYRYEHGNDPPRRTVNGQDGYLIPSSMVEQSRQRQANG